MSIPALRHRRKRVYTYNVDQNFMSIDYYFKKIHYFKKISMHLEMSKKGSGFEEENGSGNV